MPAAGLPLSAPLCPCLPLLARGAASPVARRFPAEVNMSKRQLVRAVLAGVTLAATMSGGLGWATGGSGTSSTLLGRGTFAEAFEVERRARTAAGRWKVEVAARPNLDIATQMITFDPGGQSGWHSHPGPVFISVVVGRMTFYESEDPDCLPIVRSAGQGYLD